MTGSVGKQVGQHLNDASPDRQHEWQVRRQIEMHILASPRAEKNVESIIHHQRHIRLLRMDRQRTRLDVRDVEQVGQQIPHSVRLRIDDPVKLA